MVCTQHLARRASSAAKSVALAVFAAVVLAAPCSAQEGREAPSVAPLFEALATDTGAIPVYVAPPIDGSSGRVDDAELALWALGDWSRAAGGGGILDFVPTADEEEAVVRVYFAPPGAGQYGEMMPLRVNGHRGAAVFIRPDMDALGSDIAARARSDALFRDAVVYLTCLHELGHALGLAHTSDYDDIMFAFGYGGDILEYFARYRRQLGERADIARVSGVARGDLAQLGSLYPADVDE
jgi:hypothetical protein